jgi:CO dehydrogenase maturation factor
MKIAISGKGGVGKTLIASLLCRVFAGAGYSVIAVDADPDANLAVTLGLSNADRITPISEMKELIEERTGVKSGESAPFFKLNPSVSDIPEKYAMKDDGISLMVMGRMKLGGSGCYCAENAFLQALMTHLLLSRNEVVIMDMAAGIEHLSRGTARMVDELLIVVEPGRQSIETALRINSLAEDLGIKNIALVGNKIRSEGDKEFLVLNLPAFKFLGFVSYDSRIPEADMAGKSLYAASPVILNEIKKIYQALKGSIPETVEN